MACLSGIFICACLQLHAQINLVRNPSFEQYSQCPWQENQVRLANYWDGIDTSYHDGDSTFYDPPYLPDYCNVCIDNFCCSIPLSGAYFHYPRTGNGMVDVVMYFDNSFTYPNQRDYLQGRLNTPLTAGKYYCVTFYVCFDGITASLPSAYAIDHIGAYLDDGTIDLDTGNTCGLPHPSIIPQVYTSTIITDTLNWTMIQGLITASGTERFITIGNFFDNAHTDVDTFAGASLGDELSVYLVDDVSVVETGTIPDAGPDGFVSPGSDSATIGSSEEGLPLTWFVYGSLVPIGHTGSLKVHPDTTTTYVLSMDLCDGVTFDTVTVWASPARVGNVAMRQYDNVKIWPNPAKGQLTVSNAANSEMKILNLLGQQVYDATVISNKDVLNVSQLIPGVYVVQIIAPDGSKKCMQLVKE